MHAHVTLTAHQGNHDTGEPGSQPNLHQAEIMLDVAHNFGVGRIVSMCPPEDIPALRERFGDRICFNGSISKKLHEPDATAYRLLDRYVELRIQAGNFCADPRRRPHSPFLAAPSHLT